MWQIPVIEDEDEPDDRHSAPELMLTYRSPDSHYDYPRKLSEPPMPVTLKVLHIYTHSFFNIQHTHKCSSYWKSETQTSIWQNPVTEDADEKDEIQDESAEDSSEYMAMASLYVFESFFPHNWWNLKCTPLIKYNLSVVFSD